MITERSEMTLRTIEKSGRIARWQRIAVASAKQCGRAVVPPVAAPVTLEAALRMEGPRVMLVEPAAGAALSLQALPALSSLSLYVGPEGGWTAQELRIARDSGAMLLTLGPLTLRADAVPIVAVTACRVHLEDFS
jgi:16S rRNA (uracil1498-N3)-methyltransferase